jgi:branched-chain amino acid transport system substrate-binding protein
MMSAILRWCALLSAFLIVGSGGAIAEKKYGPGVTDTEIKIGQTHPSYDVSDPTVDQQILSLKASGADTFFNVTTPRFAAQAIRKAYDIGWKPLQFIPSVSSSVASVLTAAGLEKSIGVISVAYFKDPSDPQWADTPEMKDWFAFMHKYYPDGNPADMLNVYGYTSAQTMAYVLKRCGNDDAAHAL